MFILYYAPGAASLLVHQMLIECDAAHELRRIDLDAGEQRSPAYLALNPAAVVPTLVVDGHARGEAAAMAMLLAERYPQAGLAPPPQDPERAAYLQWMLYLANTTQPAFRLWFYPAEGGDDEATVRAAARTRIEAAWTRLDAHLERRGPYLLGERASVPDLYATMLMRWSRNMPRPATAWPRLDALAARVKARPSWHAVCQREGLGEWA